MKSFLFLFLALIFIVPAVSADVYFNDDFEISNTIYGQDTTYNVTAKCKQNALEACWFEFGEMGVFYNTSNISISGGTALCSNTSELNFVTGSEVTVRLWAIEGNPNNVLNYTEQNFTVEAQEDVLSLRECPDTTSLAIILFIIVGIALFFLFIAFSGVAFVGLFGVMMLWVVSWLLSPCHAFFAYIVGGLGIVLFMYFVFKMSEKK